MRKLLLFFAMLSVSIGAWADLTVTENTKEKHKTLSIHVRHKPFLQQWQENNGKNTCIVGKKCVTLHRKEARVTHF